MSKLPKSKKKFNFPHRVCHLRTIVPLCGLFKLRVYYSNLEKFKIVFGCIVEKQGMLTITGMLHQIKALTYLMNMTHFPLYSSP